MHLLKARWTLPICSDSLPVGSEAQSSLRRAKESGRPGLGFWPQERAVAFMYGASERKRAKIGLAPHNSLRGFLPGTVSFFQGKTSHLFLVFLSCVCACVFALSAKCMFSWKRTGRSIPSFSHFAYLTL